MLIRSIYRGLAILLAAICFVAAVDFGGVLHWSKLVIGLCLLTAGAIAFALAGLRLKEVPDSTTNWIRVSFSLLCVVGLALPFARTSHVSILTVERFSPGLAEAYTEWLEPLTDSSEDPTSRAKAAGSYPLSLSPSATGRTIAFASLVFLFGWSAFQFRDDETINWLMGGLCICTGLIGAAAIWSRILPSFAVFAAMSPEVNGFGPFVNRNHGAYFFIVGASISIAMLFGKTYEQRRSSKSTRPKTLVDYVVQMDAITAISLASTVINVSAVLLSKSGVGFVALVGGIATVTIFAASAAATRSLLVLGLGVVVTGTPILLASGLNLSRAASFVKTKRGDLIITDERIGHWQDAWTAGVEYLPLGSGVGSYQYAYLPFQSQGSMDWFQHADNLWLELTVEQGIPGLIFVLVSIALLAMAANRLASSRNSLNRGLAYGLLFFIGGTVFSQLFDFGLIIPANALLASLLIGLVLTRHSRTRNSRNRRSRRRTEHKAQTNQTNAFGLQFILRRSANPMMGLFLLTSGICFVPTLRRSAYAEYYAETASDALQKYSDQESKLSAVLSTLESTPSQSQSQSHDALIAISKLKMRVARLIEINRLVRDGDDSDAAALKTSARELRMRDTAAFSTEALDLYRSARADSLAALHDEPLSFEARSQLVLLDFLRPDESVTREMLAQLGRLQSQSPEQLLKLMHFAEDSQDLAFASAMAQAAVQKEPTLARRVIRFVARHDELSLSDVIAETRPSKIAAAKFLTSEDPAVKAIGEDGLDYLRSIVDTLDCETPSSLKEKSACDVLVSNVFLRLGDVEKATEYLSRAASNDPADPVKRIQLIRMLYGQDRIEEAAKEAETASEQFPDETRIVSLKSRIEAELKSRDANSLDRASR
ncbi:MAG: O-antigen ligase family protein [Planctomycetota bacterium]